MTLRKTLRTSMFVRRFQWTITLKSISIWWLCLLFYLCSLDYQGSCLLAVGAGQVRPGSSERGVQWWPDDCDGAWPTLLGGWLVRRGVGSRPLLLRVNHPHPHTSSSPPVPLQVRHQVSRQLDKHKWRNRIFGEHNNRDKNVRSKF